MAPFTFFSNVHDVVIRRILRIKYTVYHLQKSLCPTELQWWSYNLKEPSISTTDSVLLGGKMQIFPTTLRHLTPEPPACSLANNENWHLPMGHIVKFTGPIKTKSKWKNALSCVGWNLLTETIEIIASAARSRRKSSRVPNYNHAASRNAHL